MIDKYHYLRRLMETCDADPTSMYAEIARTILSVLNDFDDTRARLDKAEAIVARLETTTDGIPMVPGDTVYVVAKDEDSTAVIECEYLNHNNAEAGYSWVYSARPGQVNLWEEFDVISVWSTREAAEAAVVLV